MFKCFHAKLPRKQRAQSLSKKRSALSVSFVNRKSFHAKPQRKRSAPILFCIQSSIIRYPRSSNQHPVSSVIQSVYLKFHAKLPRKQRAQNLSKKRSALSVSSASSVNRKSFHAKPQRKRSAPILFYISLSSIPYPVSSILYPASRIPSPTLFSSPPNL